MNSFKILLLVTIFFAVFAYQVHAQTFCSPDKVLCTYSWSSEDNKTAYFRVEVLQTGVTWASIGLGSKKMVGAEIYLAVPLPNNTISVTRRNGKGNALPQLSSNQYHTVQNETYFNTTTGNWHFTFSRPVSPESVNDFYAIDLKSGFTDMIWAWSFFPTNLPSVPKHVGSGSVEYANLFSATSKWIQAEQSSLNGSDALAYASSLSRATPRSNPFSFWMIAMILIAFVI